MTDPTSQLPTLFTEQQVTALLRLKPNTLRMWRYEKPPRISFFRVGKKPMYQAADVLAYLAHQRNRG